MGLTLQRLTFDHLLAPMGAEAAPQTIAAAVDLDGSLLAERERDLGVQVDHRLAAVVRQRLGNAGLL